MTILHFPEKPRRVAETYVRSGQGYRGPDSAPEANLTGRAYAKDLWSEMSYPLLTAVLPLKLPANEKHVLTVLAFHADADAECWPSSALLAKECCLHIKEVGKCLLYLKNGGFLRRDFRKGRSTVYHLLPSAIGVDRSPLIAEQNDKLNACEERQLTEYEKYQLNLVRFEPVRKRKD